MSEDMDEFNIDDLLPGKKKKHKKLIDELKEIEEDDFHSSTFNKSEFLPSSMLKDQESEKPKEEKESVRDDYSPDDWYNEMLEFQSIKINKKNSSDIFLDNLLSKKKKKKKKKKEKEKGRIDYKKEFEPEAAIYKNLLMEQTHFTESLQKEYDSIKSTKSSSRGMSKQLTDLIDNITKARDLAARLVDKQVSIKKQVAELNMKQNKEFLSIEEGGNNMAEFASNYMKQLLDNRKMILEGSMSDPTVSDYTDDELFEELTTELESSSDRSEEADLYLKYENRNVTVYVVITDNDIENYEFVARDEEGEIIEDYPMPTRTRISVNRSTNIATDTYGKKFQIIWNNNDNIEEDGEYDDEYSDLLSS